MKPFLLHVLAAGLFLGAGAAHGGEILRCVAADGAVSYTNVGCPADGLAQHIASYEPVPNTPTPPYALPRASDDLDARIALQAERARELGYHQAEADLAQAAARTEQADLDTESDLPIYLPVYPGGFAHGGGRRESHHHHRPGMHGNATATNNARSPNSLPLSPIPFYRPR